jgi:uncharacterized protein DUF3455
MKTCSSDDRNARRKPAIAGAVAASLLVTALVTQPALAHKPITPPKVPANIEVLPPNKPFLVGHALGTQNYVCLPSGNEFKFKLFTPQATLFDNGWKQVTTHFFSPDPGDPAGTIRATWQHSEDTSTVWGKVVTGDNATVDPKAIDWLRVTVTTAEAGRKGALARTTFIQRVNTTGGLAPAADCTSAADVGKQAFVPYTADYVFYSDR